MVLGKPHNCPPQLHVRVAVVVMGTAPPRVKIHVLEDARTTVVLSAKVVKMVVPLVVVEDVMEVAIQRVNQLVLAVVKVDVIQHVRGDVIIGVQTGVVNVREDVPHTVHRVASALAVGVHRIRVLPVHAQEHVWAVIWVNLKILHPTVQVILLAHSLQVHLVHLMVLDIHILLRQLEL